MQTVELFSGTESFSQVADKLGHKTLTLDVDSRHEPDLCKSILDAKRKDFPTDVDVLWASPPCQGFSVASIGSSWCGNYCPKRLESALGQAYVLKTLELIRQICPTYWFIENPRGVLRKMAFMDGLKRNTVTYCQYGDERMKPTDIWTNLGSWIPKPMCKNGDKCHVEARRGAKTGTQGRDGAVNRSRIPSALFEEIFKAIEKRDGFK
jgi:site-specific DNA-cytosine methylase